MVHVLGGIYSGDLVANHTTHLVVSDTCDNTSSRKRHMACQWNIPIVPYRWLRDCSAAGGFVDHHPYTSCPIEQEITCRMQGLVLSPPASSTPPPASQLAMQQSTQTTAHANSWHGTPCLTQPYHEDEVAGYCNPAKQDRSGSKDSHLVLDDSEDDIVCCSQPQSSPPKHQWLEPIAVTPVPAQATKFPSPATVLLTLAPGTSTRDKAFSKASSSDADDNATQCTTSCDEDLLLDSLASPWALQGAASGPESCTVKAFPDPDAASGPSGMSCTSPSDPTAAFLPLRPVPTNRVHITARGPCPPGAQGLLRRPPRGTTVRQHHGLASLRGVVFVERVHVRFSLPPPSFSRWALFHACHPTRYRIATYYSAPKTSFVARCCVVRTTNP